MVGHRFNEADLMTHVENSTTIVGKITDHRANALRPVRIKTAGRLVKHENPRSQKEAAGKRHALAQTSGQLMRKMVQAFGKLELLDHFIHCAAVIRHAPVAFAMPHCELEILTDRKVGKERVMLEDDSHRVPPERVQVDFRWNMGSGPQMEA